jgi:hypothetical protein
MSPIRAAYIEAIQAADRLDYAPFIKLHEQYASSKAEPPG